MKNNRFSKATALAMGLLVIFSSQALSFPSHQEQLNNQEVLGKSHLWIAQERVSVSVAVAVAVRVLDRAVSVVETASKSVPVNIPSEHRDIILPKLRQAQKSMARAESSARRGENTQVATAISQAVSFMGEATATAQADAGSVRAITQAVAKANEALAAAQARTKI